MIYPLAKNCLSIEDIDALKRFIGRGQFTMGIYVKKFEDEFDKAAYNVMTNSGSSANLLLIASFISTGKLQAGDKVIVPAVSWSTTYFPLVQYGLIPVFVDIDHNFQIDVCELVDAYFQHEAKAIFLVNLLGLMPTDFISSVRKSIANYNFRNVKKAPYIFLDNCEGYGSNLEYNLCDGVTHSFFFSHQLNTMEGGMLSLNGFRKTEFDHAKSLRAHGWVREQDDNSSLYQPSGNTFQDSFTFATVGYCLRPLEISGYLGKIELEKWPRTKKIRDTNHKHFCETFKNKSYLLFSVLPFSENTSCFAFPLVLKKSHDRNRVVQELAKEGIDSRPIIGGNFLNQPVMRKFKHISNANGYEVAETIDKKGFLIGNYGEDLKEKINMVHDIIEKTL